MASRTGSAARLARTFAVACAVTAVLASGASAQEGSVLVTTVTGAITPVIADHLRDSIALADERNHSALVVQLDTPGGLDTSMREIVQAFLDSPVPVIVHVAPPGARAASAGAIIAWAAHVAVMAPGTNIGAATPVDLQGGEVNDKAVNDAAAYVEELARLRGRNPEFAVEAVRDGRSVGASDAVSLGVVDLVAEDIDDLLTALDGRAVELASGEVRVLRTAGTAATEYDMTWVRRVLQRIADPNLAFTFLSLGSLAIVYEVAHPGVGAGGVLGAILILMSLFALSVLPVNSVGAILLLLAGVMFIIEIFIPGIGVMAAGGTVALLLGGLFLFQRRSGIGIDLAVLIPSVVVAGVGTIALGRLAFHTRNRPNITGEGALIGRPGVVRSTDGTVARVVVDGVWWKARTFGPALRLGAPVRVIDVDGLELVVEPEEGTP